MRSHFHTENQDQVSFGPSAPWVWKLLKNWFLKYRFLTGLFENWIYRVLEVYFCHPAQQDIHVLSMNVSDAHAQSHVGWMNGKFSVLFSSIHWHLMNVSHVSIPGMCWGHKNKTAYSQSIGTDRHINSSP